MGLLYYMLKTASQTSTKVYFKTIYVLGQDNIPKDGPVIICGNHSNQFIDPLMIMNYCNREVSFTIAASSFNKKVVGPIARLLNAIPVHRPEDYKVKSKSKAEFILAGDKVNVRIHNFIEETKQFKDSFSLMIGTKTFTVDQALDNNLINIKESPEYCKDFLTEVYKNLSNNGCIVIFPEGTSHDQTDFLKLKAGIAHFALGAMSEYKTKNINIVPVGLNYFNRNEFRSEVIIEFGKPFEVPSELANKFTRNKREATEILLSEIHSRMKAVTLTAPSFIELRSLLLLRKLYLPHNVRLSPQNYSDMCKKFSKGYDKLKSKTETKRLMTKIHKYIQELEITGISDHEVRRIQFSLNWMFRKLFLNFVLFHICLIMALPGILFSFPFVIYIRKKAEKERLAAKAKNPNKVEALDVVSSAKFQYCLLLAPLIVSLWVSLILYYFNTFLRAYYIFKDINLVWIVLFSLISLPLYVYFVVISLDYIEKCKQIFYSRFLYFVFPNKIIKLKKAREYLSKQIKVFVKRHITDLEEKYKLSGEDEITTINQGTVERNKRNKLFEEINRFYVNFNIMNN